MPQPTALSKFSMGIEVFDAVRGVYCSRVSALNASLHSHPALELVVAREGVFSLRCCGHLLQGLKWAVVDRNVPHELRADHTTMDIVLVEYASDALKAHLQARHGMTWMGGYCASVEEQSPQFLEEVLLFLAETSFDQAKDKRVQWLVDHLRDGEIEHVALKQSIFSRFGLSGSRWSHLFKEQMGLSMKKYLLWCKLRRVVDLHLQSGCDLYTALIDGGFYDQPHFNRCYKSMMGVTPGKTYSSIVQSQS